MKTPLQKAIEREEKLSADFKLIEEIVGVMYKHSDAINDSTWLDSDKFYNVAEKIKLIFDNTKKE